mgnify:FL=1
MKKIVVFPINREYLKLLSVKLRILKKYNLVGITVAGEKISGCKTDNIKISNDFYSELKDADILWILDTIDYIDFDKVILPRVQSAIKSGVEVYASHNIINEMNKIFSSEKLHSYDYKEIMLDIMDEYCLKIDTPIVCIAGIGDLYEQFYIELNYRREILNKEIKMFQLGSRRESKLFGFEPIPNFVFDNQTSVKDKIIMFNHYLKQIEIEYTPELIVIGIPGSLITLEEGIKSDYGIIASILTATINIDYSIIQIPYGLYPLDAMEKLSKVLGIKYGLYGDCYIVSNKMIALNESREEHEIRYIKLPENLEEMKGNSVKAMYIYEDFAESLVMDSITKLENYSSIRLI